jgi:two-component sensor histidine kinase
VLAATGRRAWADRGVAPVDAHAAQGLRFDALRVGYWLGWASIAAVLAGTAFDVGSRHRWLLVASTLAAAAANTGAMLTPWREWLTERRGRLLLDLWCAGLIAFIALLVVDGSSMFTLLLFLAAPFMAVAQAGWRRVFWLAVSASTCVLVTALVPLSAGAAALRLTLVAAAVAAVLVLARAVRGAVAQAEFARLLAKEASHRIKNDLQATADLLMIGRPGGEDGVAFDETAARIRSIAAVHQLLTETGDRIDGAALLASIARNAPVPVHVAAEPAAFDAATAQKLGLVANELVTNAFRHGAPPIQVSLSGNVEKHLCVDDQGSSADRADGFGLELVRQTVVQGLGGRFSLHERPGGGTRAEVFFRAVH